MKTSLLVAAAGVCVASASSSQWDDFKTKFNKVYTTNMEEAIRKAIFEKNMKFISDTNEQNLGYVLGVNQFSDLGVEEWSSQYFGMSKPSPSQLFGGAYLGRHVQAANETVPDSIDWVAKGAVTAVKNQGQCGSCWAFSTTGSLEGAHQVQSGTLVSLSEQQFVDCAGSYGNQGCNGGLMDNAFKYAEQAIICTEDSYPYKAAAGSCSASNCKQGLANHYVTGFKDVDSSSEQGLMSAVAQQPVSIAIEADKPVFQSYQSGVLGGMCGAQLDHGVLVVGYGKDPKGGDYWKVKNSWGDSWGEQGYVRLLRGKGGTGECGILTQPSYPVVSSGVKVSTVLV